MPYKSEAQRKYFNANRKKLEAEGVDVDHWNEESKGKKLPEKKAFTPDTSFADGYDEAQLREALAERVRMIAQLRAHRDALLDAQSGYVHEKRAYGYSDDYGYIERVPWLNSQSRTEVLERMAKAQKLAKKQNLDLTYETSRWGDEGISPENAYKMVEALPDSAFTGEFGYGSTDDTVPWSVSSFTRDGSKYNFRKDPLGIYDHLYGGDDDHEYDEYGNSNIHSEGDLDNPIDPTNTINLGPKKSLLGNLFGKQASLAPLALRLKNLLPKMMPKRTVYRGAPDPLDFSKGKVVEGVPQLHASSSLATAKQYVPKGSTRVGSFKVPRDQKYFVPFGLEGKERLPSVLRQGHTLREAKSFAKSNPLQVVPYDAAKGHQPEWFDYLPMSVRNRYQKAGQRVVPVPKGEKAKSPVSIKDIVEGLTYETAVTPSMKPRYKQANYSVVQNMAWIAAQQEKSAGNYLRNSLIGAGIGGLVGGFSDWMNEDENKPEDSLLDGILGGATVGGLGGLGYTALRDLRNKSNQAYAAEPYADQFSPPSGAEQESPVSPDEFPLTEADKDHLKSQGFLRGPRARMSELPSSSRSDAKSLADNLPENYREEAQRNAQRYRDSGDYFIDSAEIDNPFMQDISDRAIDRKVNIERKSPEEIANLGGDRNAKALHLGFTSQPAYFDPIEGTETRLDSPVAVEDKIVVPFGPIDKHTLGHELTHATQDTYTTGSRRANKRPYYKRNVENLMRNRGLPLNQASRYAEYLTNPSEEEAYLAEIKRRYFESTGKHVKNQKDALKALEWAKRNPDDNLFDALLKDNFIERAVGSEEKKSWIRGLIERMPGLVKDNTLNSGIKTAGTSKMDNNDITNLAKEAVAQEKQAFNAAVLKGIGKQVGKQLGKGTQNLVDFTFFRKGIDPAQVAGFGAGSVGDVAFDPEQRAQIASGQVPSKLWNPEESTGHNIEGLWRRGFQGLAAGSVANPARLAKKVRQGATANIAKKNQALKANLPKGTKLIDTPDTGDYAWALGKETLPKATALGIGYAPGAIMSAGEAPDLVRSTLKNVDTASGAMSEAVEGKGGLAESIKGTGTEIRRGVNDTRKAIEDVRKNITGKDAGLPALLESLKGTSDAAAKQVGEGGPLDQLNENLEPAGELASTINSGLQSAGAGLKSFGNWVGDNYGKLGLGALGAAGLYGLYKVMRRKAEEKEDEEERSRYVYRMPKTAAEFGAITAMQVKEAENKALDTSLKIAPHTAIFGGTMGAGVGGLHGLLKDPGYDEETGKKKSRLMNALKGLGMGGAIGAGAGGLLPPASVLATQGYGKVLTPLHKRIEELQG